MQLEPRIWPSGSHVDTGYTKLICALFIIMVLLEASTDPRPERVMWAEADNSAVTMSPRVQLCLHPEGCGSGDNSIALVGLTCRNS